MVLGEKESVPLASNAGRHAVRELHGRSTTASIASSSIRPSGERLTASPQYTVDLLTDLAPTVKLSKPGRDTDATPVEEFFVEAQADDDYAVKNLQLVYPINGGPEKVIPLFGGAQADQRSHRRAHLLHGGARRQGRRLGVVLRARHRQRRGQRREADEQRHLFPAHPSVRQELQAGGVDGGRRRWRRWRRPGSRRAVAAAAPDHFRHLQHPARSQDHDRGEVPRGHGGADAGAEQAARPGQRPGRAHEQPPRRVGSVVQEDRGAAAESGGADDRRGEAAAGAEARRRAAAREPWRCSSCSRPKKSSSCRCRPAARPAAAVAAAARDRSRTISPTCSRWKWTRWRISTRPIRRPRRSSRISRSTSSPRN